MDKSMRARERIMRRIIQEHAALKKSNPREYWTWKIGTGILYLVVVFGGSIGFAYAVVHYGMGL